MDPFSLTTEILALLGVCMKAARTFERIKKLKDAPSIIQCLNNEISDMYLIIADINDFFHNARNDQSRNTDADRPILELCASVLQQANEKVQEVEAVVCKDFLKPDHGSDFKINKSAFLRGHQKLSQLHADLRDYRHKITGLCSHFGMKEISRIQVLLTGLSNDLPQQTQSQARIEKTLNQMMQLQLATYTGMRDRPRNMKVKLGRDVKFYDSSGVQLSVFRQPYSTSEESCTCYGRSFRAQLHSFFGSLFLGYAAVPVVSCYGEGSCSPHRDAVVRLSYFFPLWFLKFVLLFQTRFGFHGNIMCSINIRQVIPYDHLIYDLMQIDDIKGIRKLLVSGQVALEAQGPLTGTMLHGSILFAKASITKALVEMGANIFSEHHIWGSPQKTVWTLILSNSKSAEWREKMIYLFPDPDLEEIYGFTLLHKAVLGLVDKQSEAVLRSKPTQINKTDRDGRTALSWAAARGDAEAIQTLLSYSPDCNKADTLGRTPLSFAVGRDKQCTELLLQANADIHFQDFVGQTVLMRAIQYLEPESEAFSLMKVFVQAGMDVNAQNVEGETALFLATTRDYPQIARYLIQHGADPSISDKHGKSAFVYATMMNRHALMFILLEQQQDHTGRLEEYGTFMHVAASFTDAKTLRLLARGGLQRRNISKKNKAGLTPVQLAEQREDVDAEWRYAFFDFVRSINNDQPPTGSVTMPGSYLQANEILDDSDASSDSEFEDAIEYQA